MIKKDYRITFMGTVKYGAVVIKGDYNLEFWNRMKELYSMYETESSIHSNIQKMNALKQLNELREVTSEQLLSNYEVHIYKSFKRLEEAAEGIAVSYHDMATIIPLTLWESITLSDINLRKINNTYY
jgi:hypothetical protein